MKLTIAFLLLISALPLSAASLTVVNPGFEDITGESAFNEFTFGPLNGWDLYDPDSITDGGDGPSYYIGTLAPTDSNPAEPGQIQFFPGGAAEGNRVGIAFNFFGTGGGGEYGLVQTLTDTLQANTRYTLQVEVGNIDSGVDVAQNSYNLQGFSGYRIDLLADGVVLASDNNTLAGSIPDGEFRTSTLVFDSAASVTPDQQLGIRLVNLNIIDPLHPTADLEVDFDDIRLEAVVIPEPSSWILLSLVLPPAMCILRRGRRLTRD